MRLQKWWRYVLKKKAQTRQFERNKKIASAKKKNKKRLLVRVDFEMTRSKSNFLKLVRRGGLSP